MLTDEQKEALYKVFDAIGNSVLFDEPVLTLEDVNALRTLADMIGLGVAEVTPPYRRAEFPHMFEPDSMNALCCHICALAGRLALGEDAEIHAQCESVLWERRCERLAGHGGNHRKDRVSW